jgi:hypothetical protein
LINHQNASETLSISFGSGGGFTGAIEEYILRDNGVLERIAVLKTFNDTIRLKTLNKNETSDFFKKLSNDSMNQIELNEVGNITYFITLIKGKEIVRSYQWTDNSDIPTEIKLLYTTLMGHTKN